VTVNWFDMQSHMAQTSTVLGTTSTGIAAFAPRTNLIHRISITDKRLTLVASSVSSGTRKQSRAILRIRSVQSPRLVCAAGMEAAATTQARAAPLDVTGYVAANVPEGETFCCRTAAAPELLLSSCSDTLPCAAAQLPSDILCTCNSNFVDEN
jgi:hypothetical protein